MLESFLIMCQFCELDVRATTAAIIGEETNLITKKKS